MADFSDYLGVVFFSVLLVALVLVFFGMFQSFTKQDAAIEQLGCHDIEYIFDEKVCQIGNSYYFIDVDCTGFFFLDCRAQLIDVGDFRTVMNK